MTAQPPSPESVSAEQAVGKLADACEQIRAHLGRVIVGQADVIEQLMIALFAGGHCILEGVPGLAKTLIISTLARLVSLTFSRIQFTPDLMPSDITGTEVIEEDKGTGSRALRFVQGPIFANVILADEINRTPPKTQSALLEAMQENQVTAAGFQHKLPRPFFVLATQNPIEQEGTYPLPEAQLDRFMLKVIVDYPSEEEELEIVKLTASPKAADVPRLLAAREILALHDVVRCLPCADAIARYATRLVRATRAHPENQYDFVREYVAWGAGPRASQHLVMAAKSRAALQRRYFVSTDDVRTVALPVLRHRVLMNFNAKAEGIRSDDLIRRLLDSVPRGGSDELDDRLMRRVFAREP